MAVANSYEHGTPRIALMSKRVVVRLNHSTTKTLPRGCMMGASVH
jgi:hypothetical protein